MMKAINAWGGWEWGAGIMASVGEDEAEFGDGRSVHTVDAKTVKRLMC